MFIGRNLGHSLRLRAYYKTSCFPLNRLMFGNALPFAPEERDVYSPPTSPANFFAPVGAKLFVRKISNGKHLFADLHSNSLLG